MGTTRLEIFVCRPHKLYEFSYYMGIYFILKNPTILKEITSRVI